MSVRLKKNHYPFFILLVPKNFRITGMDIIPFFFAVNYRISVVLFKRTTIVDTISNTLGLIFTGCRISSNQNIFTPAGGIVFIYYRTAGKHCAKFVREKSIIQFFPVNQIFANCMTPMHISPISFVWVVLIVEVVFAVKINQSIRIVIPSSPGSKMKLRAISFFIQTICSIYFFR
ncbi:hypothetical protein ES705_41386 [subsurface metagenome]